MEEAGKEAIRTALALGHRIVPILGKSRVEVNDPDHYATTLIDAVLSGWALPTTKVAVLQDWQKGRRGEIEDINGFVVSEQRRLGGQAPVNAMLVDVAHRIERGELVAHPIKCQFADVALKGRQPLLGDPPVPAVTTGLNRRNTCPAGMRLSRLNR